MPMVINKLTENDFEIISTVELVEEESTTPVEPRLLTWQEMQMYPVLQKTPMKSGQILYRPRSEKGKELIYKVDSILAGLNETQVRRKKCIIVDMDDLILSNSFAG